jgi:hypothetical protein
LLVRSRRAFYWHQMYSFGAPEEGLNNKLTIAITW